MQFTKTIETESLSPIFVEPVLQARLAEINALLSEKLNEIKNAPPGSLRLTKSNNVVQYYHRTQQGDTSGHYIPAKNFKLVKTLAQKDYDKQLIDSLNKESKLLQTALNSYKKTTIAERIFSRLHKNRQVLISPIYMPDEEFVIRWKSISYERKPFLPDKPILLTSQKERVRSKSEIIIADTLKRTNIPYHYEFPIRLKTESGEYHIFHPDFICLNLRTREEFIWEHFGKMDDSEYAAETTRKISIYEDNGIFPGKNLIVSMETADTQINSQKAESLILQYLK